jgi:hypothetical protein
MGIKAIIAACLGIAFTLFAVVGYIEDVSFVGSIAQDSAKIAQGDNSAAQHLGETTGNYLSGTVQGIVFAAIVGVVISLVFGFLKSVGVR